jgi:hypothetical protein
MDRPFEKEQAAEKRRLLGNYQTQLRDPDLETRRVMEEFYSLPLAI